MIVINYVDSYFFIKDHLSNHKEQQQQQQHKSDKIKDVRKSIQSKDEDNDERYKLFTFSSQKFLHKI